MKDLRTRIDLINRACEFKSQRFRHPWIASEKIVGLLELTPISRALCRHGRPPCFREHPEVAIALLAALRDDTSEYVRKSVGNALRDISKKHGDLVAAELQGWNTKTRPVAQTHALQTGS